MSIWRLYLVRTRSGALYAGITTDVSRRLSEHGGGDGRGSKYLRAKGPLRLAYQVEIGGRALALKAERRIKGLAKREKEEIASSAPNADDLLRLLGLERAPVGGDEEGGATDSPP